MVIGLLTKDLSQKSDAAAEEREWDHRASDANRKLVPTRESLRTSLSATTRATKGQSPVHDSTELETRPRVEREGSVRHAVGRYHVRAEVLRRSSFHKSGNWSEFCCAEKGVLRQRRRLQPGDSTEWKKEKDEEEKAECKANLEEALTNQSMAVKVIVDKWFVGGGYGFGRPPTGEIIFIHASAVQG